MKPVVLIGVFVIGVGVGIAANQSIHIHEEHEANERLQALKNLRYKLRMQQRSCPDCVARTKLNFERIVSEL